MAEGTVPFLARLATWPAWRGFQRALRDPEGAQRRALAAVLRGSSRTEYGRRLGLAPSESPRAFQERVPAVTYDELLGWMRRQLRSKAPILAPAEILFYDRTSGSVAPSKLIPYTAGLRRSFNRMFLAWLHDLLSHGPALDTGTSFVSVSPAFGSSAATPLGVPVGLPDDRDYLSRSLRNLLGRFLLPPGEVRGLADPVQFRRALSLSLLAGSDDLEIVSLWSPTVFLVVLEEIAARGPEILRALGAGRPTVGGLALRLPRPNLGRLERALAGHSLRWKEVFPALKIISCWDAGGAREPAARLKELFPGTFVQGKGLWATEAPVTIPLLAADPAASWPAQFAPRGALGRSSACVPCLDEVFLEFDLGSGTPRLLHELEPGMEAAVIVSQKGGLLRYRLGDRVRVSGRFLRTPTLEFIGREDPVCDMAGEKLHEGFAAGVLARLPVQGARFQLLVPVGKRSTEPPRYVLVTDGRLAGAARPRPGGVPAPGDEHLADALEEALSRNFRYMQARLLGQLGHARVLRVPDAGARVLDFFGSRGRRLGDVKPAALLRDPVEGSLLAESLERGLRDPGPRGERAVP